MNSPNFHSNLDKEMIHKDHYFSENYLDSSRFLGLCTQFNLGRTLPIESKILEIGLGPGLFSILMRGFGYKLFTLDHNVELKPNIISSLPFLPIASKKFDAICAFEVLEHLPFSLFQNCLQEFMRITKNRIIISLPTQKDIFKNEFRINLKCSNRLYIKRIWGKKINSLTNPKEHFWELDFGDKNHDLVLSIASHLGLHLISQEFQPPWFHFFVFDL